MIGDTHTNREREREREREIDRDRETDEEKCFTDVTAILDHLQRTSLGTMVAP